MSDTWLVIILILGLGACAVGYFMMNKYRLAGLAFLVVGLIAACISWIELTGLG